MFFFKLIRQYIAIFIICGLWSTWPKSKFKLQIWICSFLTIALACCCVSYSFLFNKLYAFECISYTISNLLYISIVITYLTIIAESMYQKEAQANFIRKLSSVDQIFNIKLNMKIPYHKEKCEIFKRFTVHVSIAICSSALFMLHTFHRNYSFNFMYVSICPYYMAYFRLIQLSFLICLLRSRLILIIEELKNLQHAVNVQVASSHVNQTKFKNRLESLQQIYGELFISNDQSLNLWTIDRIINLKLIYQKMYESCEQINKAFGWSILIITTQAFLKFTSNFYWAVYYNFRDYIGIAIYLLIPNFILLGILAFYCSSCFQYVSN